jgi:hypothetical protein
MEDKILSAKKVNTNSSQSVTFRLDPTLITQLENCGIPKTLVVEAGIINFLRTKDWADRIIFILENSSEVYVKKSNIDILDQDKGDAWDKALDDFFSVEKVTTGNGKNLGRTAYKKLINAIIPLSSPEETLHKELIILKANQEPPEEIVRMAISTIVSGYTDFSVVQKLFLIALEKLLEMELSVKRTKVNACIIQCLNLLDAYQRYDETIQMAKLFMNHEGISLNKHNGQECDQDTQKEISAWKETLNAIIMYYGAKAYKRMAKYNEAYEWLDRARHLFNNCHLDEWGAKCSLQISLISTHLDKEIQKKIFESFQQSIESRLESLR